MDKLYVSVTSTGSEPTICSIHRGGKMIPLYYKDIIHQPDGTMIHPTALKKGDVLYSAQTDGLCTMEVGNG